VAQSGVFGDGGCAGGSGVGGPAYGLRLVRALRVRCRPQDSSLEILSELVPYEDPKVQALEAKLKEKSE
jgi:hypothetical protein